MSYLSPRLWLSVAGAVAMAALLWWVYETGYSGGVSDQAQETKRVQQAFDKAVADATNAALAAERQHRERERELQEKVNASTRALQAARSENRATVERFTAADDRLRQQLAEFAGGGGASGDTLAACNARAAELGRVLAESVRLAQATIGALAGAAEDRAAEVRALRGSWPVTTDPK